MSSVGFLGGIQVGSSGIRSLLVSGRSGQRYSVSKSQRCQVVCKAVGEASSDSFDAEVLNSELPVLVDFYATWCGPCKLVAPVMDWAAAEYDGKLRVVKIDTEKNPEFVRKYNIRGLPTLAIFSGGENLSQIEGAIGKDKVVNMLMENVPGLSE